MRFAFLCFLLTFLVPVPGEGAFPPLPDPLDPSAYGVGFQRSMQLMASSTEEQRNRVKVLFYGQSIVGQGWSAAVAEDLKARFPHADLDIRNLAIGGFSSQRLVRTMHYDVFPFYPDLIIFHVFGSQVDYEDIIRQFRSRMTADVILQTDHLKEWPDPKAPTLEEQGLWNDKMSQWYLPSFAEEYGCALQPQRTEWEAYLRTHDLEPRDLLKDAVHLNDHGWWLMAELNKRFLIVLPEVDLAADDRVRTFVVGEDVFWQDGVLELEFEGNRIEAIARDGLSFPIEVWVDGKRPSTFPEAYSFTRPSMTGGIQWPAFKFARWESTPTVETWTATLSNFNEDHSDFEFFVVGSETGADGSGRGSESFVSQSGRLVIEAGDWNFAYAREVAERLEYGPSAGEGWKVQWEVIPLHTDVYLPPKIQYPEYEYSEVLISNISNSLHHLKLVSANGAVPALKAIRVYRPPYGRD